MPVSKNSESKLITGNVECPAAQKRAVPTGTLRITVVIPMHANSGALVYIAI
jgi:hypothetical protein